MDIKKIIITDEVSEKLIDGLRSANLTVDSFPEITLQKLLLIVQVSERMNLTIYLNNNHHYNTNTTPSTTEL